MRFTFFFFAILLFASCTNEYDQTLRKELSSGIRNDSLFLGYYFGMPDTTFFPYSRQLNFDTVIRDYNATRILYEHAPIDTTPVNMVFYPEFINKKIANMPMQFDYKNWSMYRKDLVSDTLLPKVVAYFEKLYGVEFFTLTDKIGRTVHVSIAGNRRIRVFKKDERFVGADIKDMSKYLLDKKD